jgi:3-hexulose-6-phosphate synthase
MKLHFTYNLTDLNQALKIAESTAEYADILGIGSLLLFKEGINAIRAFKAAFPSKEIFAESKICEKADLAVPLMAQAGASYVSILASSFHSTIKKAVDAAKRFDVKIALDLMGAPSLGQSAVDAKTLGVYCLILHRPATEEIVELDAEWRDVRDNTQLPIFITGKIDTNNIAHLIELKPHGIMIGGNITKADNPAQVAAQFRSLVR